jgi:hypothetical protein
MIWMQTIINAPIVFNGRVWVWVERCGCGCGCWCVGVLDWVRHVDDWILQRHPHYCMLHMRIMTLAQCSDKWWRQRAGSGGGRELEVVEAERAGNTR